MQQSPSVSEGLLSPDEMLSTDDYFGRRRSGSASGLSGHSNDHGPLCAGHLLRMR